VGYDENEIRYLLALERPKKKDTSKVLYLNCKELGNFADKCPERRNKQTNKVAKRRTSTISLGLSANRRDTIQINAQRKVHEDFSELE
jgi:hypothetical protein